MLRMSGWILQGVAKEEEWLAPIYIERAPLGNRMSVKKAGGF